MASRRSRGNGPGSSVERVRAALELRRAERAPAAWWGHTYREEWSPETLAAATVERQRRFGWDFVKLQPRATCFAEAFGSEYRPSGRADAGPELVRPAIQPGGGWQSLPDIDGSVPPLADQVLALRLVAEGVGPDVPLLQTVFSPLTVAGYVAGEDPGRVVQELRDGSTDLMSALERIARALVDFAGRSITAGAAGVFYAISGYASDEVWPMEEYERLALPFDMSVLGDLPAAAWFNVLHLCGPSIHFDLTQRLPARAVSWSVHEPGNPTLREGRDRSGKAAMGGVDHTRTLVDGSPDAVRKEVRAAVEETQDAGLLLSPGCSVPVSAPDENLAAMMDAARRS